MKDTVGSRSNVELRLHVLDMGESHVHSIRFEKDFGEPKMRFQVRAPQGAKVGATFQNGLEFRIGIEAVYDAKKHPAGLRDAKMVKEMDAGRCSEGVKMYITRIMACKSRR